jgi:spore coat protein U-like protein
VPALAITCSVSPQSVNFGNYDPLSPSVSDGVGNIGISCDGVTSFTIAFSSGIGSYTARLMTSAASQMQYNLYTDATRLTIWGDGTGATATISASATGGDFAVYGRIPASQNLPVDTYTDTIIVTVTY